MPHLPRARVPETTGEALVFAALNQAKETVATQKEKAANQTTPTIVRRERLGPADVCKGYTRDSGRGWLSSACVCGAEDEAGCEKRRALGLAGGASKVEVFRAEATGKSPP